MANTASIITPNTVGIDMRLNRFFLGDARGHFARNLRFDENKIETRPGIDYTKLAISGRFLDATYHDPKKGLNALSKAEANEQLIVVTTDGIWSVDTKTFEAKQLHSFANFESAYVYSAENYAIVLTGQDAFFVDHNNNVTKSPGTTFESDGSSHDSFQLQNFNHYLPKEAELGVYIHGRNVVSTPIGGNSVLSASDILNKREDPNNLDILLWEEQAAFGDFISAPSELGKTVALSKLTVGSANGEGELFDFREHGVVRHDTFSERETRYASRDEGMVKIRDGWDQRRITNVTFTSVTATGPRAVTELPLDIMFRSEYGLHFLKILLGEGTFNDQTTNVFSQDVEPLLNEDKRLDVAKVGHWKLGSRMFATTGINSEGLSNSFVVGNQALTFTEDRTPRFGWEGAWQLDRQVENIDAFIEKGKTKNDFGIIITDDLDGIYFGSFTGSGNDIRDGVKIPIKSSFITGQFPFSGLNVNDIVMNGSIDAIIDETTKEVKVSIRTNDSTEWVEWKTWNPVVSGKATLSDTMERPDSNATTGSFFEFKIDVIGYIRIIGMTVDFKESQKRNTLKAGITPIQSIKEQYLE